MLRPFNPADVFSLLVLQTRAEPNMAWARHSLAAGQPRLVPLGSLVGEWLPRKGGRHTWVLSQRGMAIGIVSIRRRKGQGNWEVDRLLVARGKEPAAVEVLEGVNVALGRLGAERLFLRLPENSPIETHAAKAGFHPLVREGLFVRPRTGPEKNGRPPDTAVRPMVDADGFNLFRLYSSTVPAALRQVDGVTLREWRGVRDLSEGLPARDAWVMEQDGDIVAAVTVSESVAATRMMDLLARPTAGDAAATLVQTAVAARGHRDALLCLLPEYQSDLTGRLMDAEFESRGGFHVYVKYIVARVRRPGLLPVGA